MGKVISDKKYIEAMENGELKKLLDDFSKAYSLQKDVDFDDIELVAYQQGRKTVMYFRMKRKEIKLYGTQIIQD